MNIREFVLSYELPDEETIEESMPMEEAMAKARELIAPNVTVKKLYLLAMKTELFCIIVTS